MNYKSFIESVNETINTLIKVYNNPIDYNPYKDWICIASSNEDNIGEFSLNDIIMLKLDNYLKYDEFRIAMINKVKSSSYEWEFRYGINDHPDKLSFRMKEVFTKYQGDAYLIHKDDFPNFMEFLGYEFCIGANSSTIDNIESILNLESKIKFHKFIYGR